MNTPTTTTPYLVTILPPGTVNKALTANHRPDNLSEHALAFLNYHNKNGFVVEESSNYEPTLKGLLIEMRSLPRVKMSQIKQFVATVEEVTQGEITEYLGRELFAINYGYSNYLELVSNLYKNNLRFIELQGSVVTDLPDVYTRSITWSAPLAEKIKEVLYSSPKPTYLDPSIRFDLLLVRQVVELAYASKSDGIPYAQLRELATEIKCSSIKKYPHQKSLHLVFQLIGYNDYSHWKTSHFGTESRPPSDTIVPVPCNETLFKQLLDLVKEID